MLVKGAPRHQMNNFFGESYVWQIKRDVDRLLLGETLLLCMSSRFSATSIISKTIVIDLYRNKNRIFS